MFVLFICLSVCLFVCFSFTCVALDCPVCGLGVPAAVPLRCVCFEPQVPGSPTCGGVVGSDDSGDGDDDNDDVGGDNYGGDDFGLQATDPW